MSQDGVYDLVFEGGGAKGLAFVGALRALEERKVTPGRLLGTSAGAFMATLIAAGFSADKLEEVLFNRLPNGKLPLSQFSDYPYNITDEQLMMSRFGRWFKAVDIPFVSEEIEARLDKRILRSILAVPTVKQIFSFVEMGGLYAGDEIVRFMREQLDDMDGLGRATLAEFYEHTGKELTVTAADITDRRLLILNHRTAPDLPVVYAVRMSVSVPFYWQEVIWRSEWGTYRGRDMVGHAAVDGAVLSNFPMELLLSGDSYVTEIMGEPTGCTFGFLIDEELDVPGEAARRRTRSLRDVATVLRRLLNIVDTMLEAHDKLVLESYSDFVARLPANGYGTFEFDMTDERLRALINAAYNETRRRLAIWNVPSRTVSHNQVGYDELARRVISRC